MWLFHYFNFERNYEVKYFKAKESMLFVEQKYTLIKTKQNQKWKLLHMLLETNLDISALSQCTMY